MIVKNLLLSSFRKFSKKGFIFSPSVNIIIGPNAIGKTNILESLFLLATGKSFRAEESREMISFEKEIGRVQCVILNTFDKLSVNSVKNPRHFQDHNGILLRQPAAQDDSDKLELEVLITSGMVMGVKAPLKKFSINGVGKRMLDFVGSLKVVLFWPQDLELVTDSPSLRRHYLDFVLTQVDREYRRTLQSYEKGVRQRNRVLEAIRDTGAHRQQLIFWDQLLIKDGEYLTKKRSEYIDYVNNYQPLTINHQQLQYQLFYNKSIISRERLDQYSREEVASAMTLVGPHRDDMEFRVKNLELRMKKDESDSGKVGRHEVSRSLSHFGSRGEQRLGILWLKLAELAYIEYVSGDKPVLLLDDIFSELDHEYRKIIFDVIGNQQTIMTTVDLHLLEKEKIKEAKMIEL